MKLPLVIFVCITVSLAASAAHATTFRSYHIGNSLTWDSRPDWLADLPTPAGTATPGYHVKSNSSLTSIINSPTSYALAEPYPFSQALTEAWDAVVLQPFGETAGDELASFQWFIGQVRANPDNEATAIYAYGTWPGDSSDYAGVYLAPAPNGGFDDSSTGRYTRAYYEYFVDRLHAENPGETIRFIPVGDVWLSLVEDLEEGLQPDLGEDPSVLYRDAIHASGLGRHIANRTVWTVMHGRHPGHLSWELGRGSLLTEEISDWVNETIWDVVTSDPLTGVVKGDFNRDGQVTLADYTIWRDGLGSWFSESDYAVWKQQMATPALPTTTVPEPAYLGWFSLSLVLAMKIKVSNVLRRPSSAPLR